MVKNTANLQKNCADEKQVLKKIVNVNVLIGVQLHVPAKRQVFRVADNLPLEVRVFHDWVNQVSFCASAMFILEYNNYLSF